MPRNKKNEQPITLPPYNKPPKWLPPSERNHNPNYTTNLITFLPRSVSWTRKNSDEGLGLYIRGGPEREYGVYITLVRILFVFHLLQSSLLYVFL